MLNQELIEGFKNKYSNIHPLIFHRSLERAKTAGELFDILESIPEFPIQWDDVNHKWKTCDDLLRSEEFLSNV